MKPRRHNRDKGNGPNFYQRAQRSLPWGGNNLSDVLSPGNTSYATMMDLAPRLQNQVNQYMSTRPFKGMTTLTDKQNALFSAIPAIRDQYLAGMGHMIGPNGMVVNLDGSPIRPPHHSGTPEPFQDYNPGGLFEPSQALGWGVTRPPGPLQQYQGAYQGAYPQPLQQSQGNYPQPPKPAGIPPQPSHTGSSLLGGPPQPYPALGPPVQGGDVTAEPGSGGLPGPTPGVNFTGAQGATHNAPFLQQHPGWATKHPNQARRLGVGPRRRKGPIY